MASGRLNLQKRYRIHALFQVGHPRSRMGRYWVEAPARSVASCAATVASKGTNPNTPSASENGDAAGQPRMDLPAHLRRPEARRLLVQSLTCANAAVAVASAGCAMAVVSFCIGAIVRTRPAVVEERRRNAAAACDAARMAGVQCEPFLFVRVRRASVRSA